MSDTLNQELFDASIRAAIDLRRYTTSEVQSVIALLQDADKELVIQIREQLARLGLPVARSRFTYQRLQKMLASVREARAAALQVVAQRLETNLADLSALEARREEDLLQASVPVHIQIASVPLKRLASLVRTSPFEGQVLKDWFAQLSKLDQQRLERAIQIGVANGETIDQIVKRVIGSRAAFYQDGILSVTRRQAEAIVRTAVNAASNAAREEVFRENADILEGLRWTSVLDGRTTPICMARDGTVYPVDSGPRPPAHFGCRSVMVAVLNGVALAGERPFVTDSRTRKDRETDFVQEAKSAAGADWKGMSAAERRAAVAARRELWAQERVGRVPAATTYQQWLSTQSAAFQNEVLGVKKGALFRQGGLTLDQFVDRSGRALTLAELKDLYPAAWARASS